jgi:hypothetical protein
LGVNVYAKQLVDGRDRAQLERLARYVLRPPLSQERLERRDDGRLQLTLKSVWKDGTRALLLEPHDLLVRLCAAIPPPGFHMIRYFGVLSSHSAQRHEVVPLLAEPGRFQTEPAEGDQLELEWDDAGGGAKTSGRSRWGWPMRWLEAATKADAIGRLLAKHGLAARPPPKREFVPVGQLVLPLG